MICIVETDFLKYWNNVHTAKLYFSLTVRTVRKDEKKYYETLIQSSIQRLMLYPYHLADMIVKGKLFHPI